MNRAPLPLLLAPLLAAALLPVRPAMAQDGPDCLVCHRDGSLFAGRPDSARLVVGEALASSVHGVFGVPCTGCHTEVSTFPHPESVRQVECARCHVDVGAAFANSLHGYASARGNERAPTCATCHGTHDIRRPSDPESRTYRPRVSGLCAECHGHGGLLTDVLVRLPEAASGYARSVHAEAVQRGAEEAAGCADCHGVHDALGAADPRARIFWLNIAETCGRCHQRERQDWRESIHGRAVAAGISDSPTCNDCHGEHVILSPHNPEARTYAAHIAQELCGRCHDDPDIVTKYGLRSGAVASYLDSYHGWVTRGGRGYAATCVSCHGAHRVLPAEDSTSSVSPANVTRTCGQCHAGATERFARSYDHVALSITQNPINRIIRAVYVILIIVVIGGMVLHNVLVMGYYLRESRREHRAARTVRRFFPPELLQHALLALSFIVLAMTGFALRYPEAWWVRVLVDLGLTEESRGVLHRVAGSVLMGLAVAHVAQFIASRRAKQQLRAMAPSLQDFGDLADNVKLWTGRSRKGSRFGRYGYPEKAEYWALVWGTVLMAATGFVLWFPEQAVRIFPAWVVAASQTVHFYEALLATLAIVVWHFFFVIFHPDVYPMSWTWLTGRMTVEEAREKHPRWYEEEVEPTLDRQS